MERRNSCSHKWVCHLMSQMDLLWINEDHKPPSKSQFKQGSGHMLAALTLPQSSLVIYSQSSLGDQSMRWYYQLIVDKCILAPIMANKWQMERPKMDPSTMLCYWWWCCVVCPPGGTLQLHKCSLVVQLVLGVFFYSRFNSSGTVV